jgi:hypothetical protein
MLIVWSVADAVPPFKRKFAMECTTCHTPIPPRLNNLGVVFKQLGYRLPDADEEGRLILRDVPATTWKDVLTFIADGRFSDRSFEPGLGGATIKTRRGSFEGVVLFAGGTFGQGYSYTLMSMTDDDARSQLTDWRLQYSQGPPTSVWTVRVGQFNPLLWQKGGYQRLTLSAPLVLNRRVPLAGFAGFRLLENQRGIEVGYHRTALQEAGELRQFSVTLGLFNGVDRQGRGDKAFLVGDEGRNLTAQAVYLWGSDNTVSVFYSRGSTRLPGLPKARYSRLGVAGNLRLLEETTTPLDLLAGYVYGRDKTVGASATSRGWFIEAEISPYERTVFAIRYDLFDPNTRQSGDGLKGITLSATHQLNDRLFVTLEFQRIRQGLDNDRRLLLQVRFAY